MNRFTRSSSTTETVRHTVHIEDFSKHVLKGHYLSPEFESGPSGSKWTLLVFTRNGSDYEHFIDVRLNREYYVREEQFVEVKMSVVDRFGFEVLKEKKEVSFGYSNNDAYVMSVTKDRMSGYFGLKDLRYLPNDTLELKCELTVHNLKVLEFDEIKDFADSLRYSTRSSDKALEYFTPCKLTSRTFDFARHLDNFSIITCNGRYVCPDYQTNVCQGKFNLIVYTYGDDYSGNVIDVRLKHSESDQNHLAKVKLSIFDPSGKILHSVDKDVYLTESTEAPLLSVSQKSSPSVYGLIKKPLISKNSLSLHCEVVSLENDEDTFLKKEDFDNCIRASGGFTRALFSEWHVTLFLTLLAALKCLSHLCWVGLSTIMLFIWSHGRIWVPKGLLFIARVILKLLVWIFIKFKNAAVEELKSFCCRKSRSHRMSHVGGEVVPYEPENAVQYRNRRRNTTYSQRNSAVVPYDPQYAVHYRQKDVILYQRGQVVYGEREYAVEPYGKKYAEHKRGRNYYNYYR